MIRLRSLFADRLGTSAAEFALVLPVALLLFFGIIDVGRYTWALNQLEKSAQAGARYAVATDIVPDGINDVNYVGYTCNGNTLGPGDVICKDALGTITCSKSGGGVTCSCEQSAMGSDSCPNLGTANATAFTNIVNRMRVTDARITEDHVSVIYAGSGIGFAGDPGVDDDGNPLSDVAPLVTVEVAAVSVRLMLLLGGAINLPSVSYTLTLEDGDGAVAY